MSTDLEVLDEVARASVAGLDGSSELRGLLELRGHRISRSKKTDGWYATIAYLPKERLYVELWLDRWTRHADRALWYGVSTTKPIDLQGLARRLSSQLGAPLERRDGDAGDGGFKRALTKDEYGAPVLELYRTSYSFYGIYVFPQGGRIGLQALRSLTHDILGFVHAVTGSRLPDEEDSFPEGKVAQRRHQDRERNATVIRNAKSKALLEHGRLACEVCQFEFKSTYGQLGEDFIEAHHLVPLSESKKPRRTRVADLALVCANCHRMLHRRRPWLIRENLRDLLAPGEGVSR